MPNKTQRTNCFITFLSIILKDFYMDFTQQEISQITHDLLPLRSQQEIETLARNLLNQMTINEKIGQLFQLAPPDAKIEGLKWERGEESESTKLISSGLVGSVLSVFDTATIYKLQKIAVEQSRLGIPMFFGADIIHGCRTGFPINLAMAGSFNPELVEEVCKSISYETAHAGINMTFSPMVDLVRDPRWGRVMESNGEDQYLNCKLGIAYVQGFQQHNLSDYNATASCCKHFAAYGAVEAGREYNTVDMSERELRQHYLPGYKACANAGVASFMTSFNIINGVPSTANKFLLTDILRNEWNYSGVVISDYTSSFEMLDHKTAKNEKEVAYQCIQAGLDHEMVSMTYLDYLEELISEGRVDIKLINQAALRVIQLKYQMGLFDNPYKNIYVDAEQYMRTPEIIAKSNLMARKSVVLLKNEQQTLPLQRCGQKIALIGPFAESNQVMGAWSGLAKNEECVSLADGIRNLIGSDNLFISQGCEINDSDYSKFADAIELAKQADVIVLALGEDQTMSGEAKSRAFLNIPGLQNDLAREIHKLGKPIVLVNFSGRPVELTWYEQNVAAILQAWFLGNESGNALAAILFGDENPSAKLAMSFPYTVGQCPVYYNQYKTGRPSKSGSYEEYRSAFIDVPNYPLYPFGFGLSYTQFEYSNLTFNTKSIHADEKITISVNIQNIGAVFGEEIVQLYIECKSFSVVRPMRELKGFQRIQLNPNETKTISFELGYGELAYYNIEMKFTPENSKYIVYIGGNSNATLSAEFCYTCIKN